MAIASFSSGAKLSGAQRMLAEICDRALLLETRTQLGLSIEDRPLRCFAFADIASVKTPTRPAVGVEDSPAPYFAVQPRSVLAA